MERKSMERKSTNRIKSKTKVYSHPVLTDLPEKCLPFRFCHLLLLRVSLMKRSNVITFMLAAPLKSLARTPLTIVVSVLAVSVLE